MRSERALKLAIAEMYVKGVSTRRVSDIVEILVAPKSARPRSAGWQRSSMKRLRLGRRSLSDRFNTLVLDATYESVRVGSHVVKQALLVAIGVDYSGNRHILDAEVANSEAEVNWRSFLEGLVRRGMHGLRMITSDDHSGLRAAIDAVFPEFCGNAASFICSRMPTPTSRKKMRSR